VVIRVVVAGIGEQPREDDPLDAVSAALRNHGAEVIYTGWAQSPQQVVVGALQEDVAAIGLCGAATGTCAEIEALLAEDGAADITVFALASGPEPLIEWVHGHR